MNQNPEHGLGAFRVGCFGGKDTRHLSRRNLENWSDRIAGVLMSVAFLNSRPLEEECDGSIEVEVFRPSLVKNCAERGVPEENKSRLAGTLGVRGDFGLSQKVLAVDGGESAVGEDRSRAPLLGSGNQGVCQYGFA